MESIDVETDDETRLRRAAERRGLPQTYQPGARRDHGRNCQGPRPGAPYGSRRHQPAGLEGAHQNLAHARQEAWVHLPRGAVMQMRKDDWELIAVLGAYLLVTAFAL